MEWIWLIVELVKIAGLAVVILQLRKLNHAAQAIWSTTGPEAVAQGVRQAMARSRVRGFE